MLKEFGSTVAKALTLALIVWSFCVLSVAEIRAQDHAQPNSGGGPTATVDLTTKTAEPSLPAKKPETVDEKLSALQQQMEKLQKTVEAQQETIRLLARQLSRSDSSPVTPDIRVEPTSAGPQIPSVEERLKKVESSVSQLGNIKFSGDIRLRSESIFGQSNTLAAAGNPLVFGNELTPRHRMRLRARLTMRGVISEEFEWGLRLATGSLADNISTNQTFTDFFNRKPFALDQAFITYKPRKLAGLRLQGGRFEPPWTATEMTIDNDLMVDGFNQSYSRTSKDAVLKDVTFVAWQLPMLERNSAFVRNADGTVNVEQSRRGGRDLALYGGQLRTRFEPSSKVALNLSIADLYFSGTQLISPVQVFGSMLQIPVIVSLPGGGTVTSSSFDSERLTSWRQWQPWPDDRQ